MVFPKSKSSLVLLRKNKQRSYSSVNKKLKIIPMEVFEHEALVYGENKSAW